MKKSPFIDGFREPTLSNNSFYLLSDVRGDGEGKLVIWAEQQQQLIVYKGTNRELEKHCKITNVNGMIEYYDQEVNCQPAIALSAGNALYIFRGLTQSFRLKIPDVSAQVDQQMIWSQYSDPDKITTELTNIKSTLLSEKAKYYLGARSTQQKQQIIEKVFSEGICEQDSISAMSVLKQVDVTGLGNVIIGTQLNRLYILDNYGHRIIHERIIDFAPCFLFGYGSYQNKYVIICISRSGVIAMFLQNDINEPSQIIRLNTRVISADLSYPDFVFVTADKVVSLYSFSQHNFKLSVPRYSIKFTDVPIKVGFMKQKGIKLLFVGFRTEFRIYREKQVVYRQQTEYPISNFTYGSFAKQQNCLIIMYEKEGFEVLIAHRMFNPRQTYEPKLNKSSMQDKKKNELILPKKTAHFMKYWRTPTKSIQDFKSYQKCVKLLKWRTLREKVCDQKLSVTKVQISPKVQGLGPHFLVVLQIENLSKQPIFNITILNTANESYLQVIKQPKLIHMLPPFTPVLKQLEVISLSLKAEKMSVILGCEGSISSTVVYLPACQEMDG